MKNSFDFMNFLNFKLYQSSFDDNLVIRICSQVNSTIKTGGEAALKLKTA